MQLNEYGTLLQKLLVSVNHKLAKCVHKIYKPFGITRSQSHFLKHLQQCGGSVDISVLASAMQTPPSNVTNISNRLVKAQLIKKSAMENDHRKVQVSLTSTGKEMLHKMDELQNKFVDYVASFTQEEQRAKVIDGLKMLDNSLELALEQA